MFHKVFIKKKSEEKQGFHVRMMATMIDFFLISFLVEPVLRTISNLIYGIKTPNYMIKKFLQEMAERKIINLKEIVSSLSADQELHNYLYNEYGFIKIITDQVIQILVIAIIFIVFWVKKQATPGKMIMKLKIVDFKTKARPTSLQFVIRFIGCIISAIPFFMGYLWIIFDKNKRSLHDYLSGTEVISIQKEQSS